MKKKLLLLAAVLVSLALLALGCSLPQGPGLPGGTLPMSGEEDSVLPAVENDTTRNQAVYITASGLRLDIQSVEEEGGVVRCVEAFDLAPASPTGDADELAALIIGRREDGRPGLWAVHGDDSIRALPNARGRMSCLLSEPEDVEFMVPGLFGWVYHATELSPEGENGWIIIGYAENPEGFEWGRWSVEPGTTVGVYWRVRKHPHEGYYFLSPARVIGVFKASPYGAGAQAPDGPERNQNRRRRGFGLGLLKLFLLDWLENYLAMTTGVDYREGLFLVTGPDKDGVPSQAAIDEYNRIVIEPLEPQNGKPDLVPGGLTAESGPFPDGSDLPLELSILNQGTAGLDQPFHLRFFLAAQEGFPDNAVELEEQTVTPAQPLPAGGTLSYQTVINLPDDLDLNGWYYLGVRLDSQGEIDESDEGNNSSGSETAALIALIDDEAGPQDYELLIQAFPPTGEESGTFAKIELFSEGGVRLQAGTVYDTPWVGIGTQDNPLILSSGTYYVKVSGANPVQTGPYGISARLAAVALEYYAGPLTGNSEDTAEPDDAETAPNIPAAPLQLYPADPEGSRANRYIGSGDADWAVIILP
jgi:hypothetical protein